MKKIEYTAFINSEGKIIYGTETINKLKIFLSENIGREIDVIIDSDVNRSKAQNRFFHGNLIPAIQRCLTMQGMPGAENADFVKEIILKKPYLTVNKGTGIEYVRPTSSLTVREFWEFCNWCLTLLVQIGGSLNAKEQEEYLKIIERYHLNDALDQKLEDMK